MPFNVTLPNGVTVEGVPDGTTKEQVMQKAISSGLATEQDFAMPSTEPEATQQNQPQQEERIRASPRMRQGLQRRSKRERERKEYMATLSPEDQQRMGEMGYGSRLGRGAREGVETFGRGLAGLVGFDAQRSPEELAELEMIQRSDPYGAYSLGEFAGEVAPSLVGGVGVGMASKAANLGRMASGAANIGYGGLEGAALAEGKGQDPVTGALLGAVGAGAGQMLPAAAQQVGRAGKRLGQTLTGTRPAGHINPQTMEVSNELREALGKQGIRPEEITDDVLEEISAIPKEQLNPDQAARYALYKKQGINPTRAQVTRSKDDALRESDLARVDSNLSRRIDEQTDAVQGAFEQQVRDMGEAGSPDAYVHDVVVARDQLMRDATKQAYQEAAEDAAQQGVTVNPENLVKTINKYSKASKQRRATADAMRQELRGLGIINKKGEVVKNIDAEDAESIRQTINQFIKKPHEDMAGLQNPVTQALVKGFDEDLARDMNTEMFKQARKNAAKHFKAMEVANRTTGRTRSKSIIKDLLKDEGGLNPDTLVSDVVFSRKYDDLQLDQLRKFMEGQGQAGKEAFDNLRADTLQELFDRGAIKTESATGARKMTAAKFNSALKKIGDRKLRSLFTKEEIKFLKNNAKMLNNMTPPAGTGQGMGGVSNTIGVIESMAGRKVPVVGDFISNAAKAIRESAADKLALSSALKQLANSPDRIPMPVASAASAAAGAATAQQQQ